MASSILQPHTQDVKSIVWHPHDEVNFVNFGALPQFYSFYFFHRFALEYRSFTFIAYIFRFKSHSLW